MNETSGAVTFAMIVLLVLMLILLKFGWDWFRRSWRDYKDSLDDYYRNDGQDE